MTPKPRLCLLGALRVSKLCSPSEWSESLRLKLLLPPLRGAIALSKQANFLFITQLFQTNRLKKLIYKHTRNKRTLTLLYVLYTLYGLSSHFFTVTDIAPAGSMPMTRVYTSLLGNKKRCLTCSCHICTSRHPVRPDSKVQG